MSGLRVVVCGSNPLGTLPMRQRHVYTSRSNLIHIKMAAARAQHDEPETVAAAVSGWTDDVIGTLVSLTPRFVIKYDGW